MLGTAQRQVQAERRQRRQQRLDQPFRVVEQARQEVRQDLEEVRLEVLQEAVAALVGNGVEVCETLAVDAEES